jgi:hypothetical protein
LGCMGRPGACSSGGRIRAQLPDRCRCWHNPRRAF